jgi:hypothetical protein
MLSSETVNILHPKIKINKNNTEEIPEHYNILLVKTGSVSNSGYGVF